VVLSSVARPGLSKRPFQAPPTTPMSRLPIMEDIEDFTDAMNNVSEDELDYA